MEVPAEMIQIPWRRTKIVCTHGPSTDPPGDLAGLLASGMNVARIDAILVDLPGAKLQLGPLPGGSHELIRGSQVTLVEPGDRAAIPVPHQQLLESLQANDSVYLTDGAVELRVKSTASGRVYCEVVVGGIVRSGSGVNSLEPSLSALVPTAEDQRGQDRVRLVSRTELRESTRIRAPFDGEDNFYEMVCEAR